MDLLPSIPVAGRRAPKPLSSQAVVSVADCLSPSSPGSNDGATIAGRSPLKRTGRGGLSGVPEGTVFGRSTVPTDSVAAVMESYRQPVFAPPARPYASELREPIGKGRSFGMLLPDKCLSPEYKFGKPSVTEISSKELLFPPGDLPRTNPTRECMFQRQRNYDWARAGINPTAHVFGSPSKKEVVELLSPTKLADVQVVAHRAHALRPSPPKLSPRAKEEQLSVAAVLTEANPGDPDTIGKREYKSVTLKKLRESDPPKDVDRVGGVPSVRLDLPSPKLQKIAEERAIGPQPTAGQVLFGSHRRTDLGYGARLPDAAAAIDLCNRCRLDVNADDVYAAFQCAAERSTERGGGGVVTIDGFMDAMTFLGL